jgi:hypothetical protein
MEETKEQQSQHRFLLALIYFSVLLEVLAFVYARSDLIGKYPPLLLFVHRLIKLKIYQQPIFSKLFTLTLICLSAIGTLSRKEKDLNPQKAIVYPMAMGLLIFFGGIWFDGQSGPIMIWGISWYQITYIGCALIGTLLLHVALGNISKIISFSLGKDLWNVEGESFMQRTKPGKSEYAVNIPMLFYYKKKVRSGFIVIDNIFRGALLIGTPGSGKTFGVVNPYIRQLIAHQFSLCIYDFKFPDLGKVAYYHYLLAKQQGLCPKHDFHVINLTEVEKSRRINVFRKAFIQTLADASETAEALVEALKKGDKSGGSDQFFTQSAINFLSACIYFFSQYQDGKYASFPHVLAFLNCSYEEIFSTLFSNPELASLLSPFMTAYQSRAFDQLEGQVGTLKIFTSRLATKECFWVFSGDDFNLKISDRGQPSILILANDPNTQNINSACYSVILNRLTRLVNTKGNLPTGIIIDEVPTLYVHRVENLIATARSNQVAVLMGLQELPQFQQQYGKDTASTIAAVVGNVLSGSVRNKETLDWLERLCGKIKQPSESLSIDRNKTSASLSEKLEPLIPAGKIASLKAGELIGVLATDAVNHFNGQFETTAVNCKVNLNMENIRKEEAAYRDLPVYYDFNNRKTEILQENFLKINWEVQEMVKTFKKTVSVPAAAISKGAMRPGFKN